jgi:hypothetical protein
VPRPRILTSLGAKAADEAGLPPLPADGEILPEQLPPPGVPGASLPVLNLTAPLPTAAELAERNRQPAPEAATAEAAGDLTVANDHSPGTGVAVIRTFGRFAKVMIGSAFLLGGLFYVTKFILLPFYHEMQNPNQGAVDRSAPAAVQVLQQTRKVVVENNARMAKLNDIVDGVQAEVATRPAAGGPAEAKSPEPRPVRSKAAEADRLFQIQMTLDGMKITGVTGGADPRAVIDGRMVKFGDVVDYRLGLRFVEVHEEDREVRFIDPEGTIYRRPY